MRSIHKLVSVTLVTALATGALVACKRQSDDDEDEDEATSGVASNGGRTGGLSVEVNSMSDMPAPEEILKSERASLALTAVNGTPPEFSDMTVDNVQSYLTGDVATLVTAITAAKNETPPDWAEVQSLGGTFRDGLAKCQIMQDAGRQLSDLTQRTMHACYMMNIDRPGQSLLRLHEGVELAAGAFFEAGADDVVRAIKMGGELDKIVFQIRGANKDPGTYQVTMTFCKADGSAEGVERIKVDNATGLLTHQMYHSGSRTRADGVATTFTSSGTITGYLSQGAAAYTFDETRRRTMALQNSGTLGTNSQAMSGEMVIEDGVMTTRAISKMSFTANGQTATNEHRGVSSVHFSGTRASNIVVYQGAGRGTGSFTPAGGSTTSHSRSIGFEFDESQSPQYATISSSTYLDTVNAVDFATDPVLSLSEPAAPDAGLMSADACAATPESTYRFGASAEQMQALRETCDSRFEAMDRICETLRTYESAVWSALKASPQGVQ